MRARSQRRMLDAEGLAEAVQRASVSGANSLLTGKRTGNFTKLATSAEKLYQKTPVPQGFPAQVPTQRNRELFGANRDGSGNCNAGTRNSIQHSADSFLDDIFGRDNFLAVHGTEHHGKYWDQTDIKRISLEGGLKPYAEAVGFIRSSHRRSRANSVDADEAVAFNYTERFYVPKRRHHILGTSVQWSSN